VLIAVASSAQKNPERPIWEMRIGMSEYPRTGIDKAVLKFGRQVSKISQIVSVKISAFFLDFIRQLLPDCSPERLFSPLPYAPFRP
jgi:hypothetical protein